MLTVNYRKIEQRAKAAGSDIEAVLSRAGITYRTWFNWKTGRIDPLDRINRVQKALGEIEKNHEMDKQGPQAP
ncbi:hypothetical protein GWO43_30300 [candidate division KSB1 bacterium]|nr:hypothetical protein [candidate division KSB1 bacterium]NIV70650.1 hypothetical protein [Phycisphaerae bacterium]NIS28181.1 hypothetical protein [candidate division KSB1 bacterium]NIT75074.1 hypothetical protein [candidate division KSB1 bacterium]NIU28860.1 hypothetical protein [candidate division KSB1 bacterium]